MPLDIRYIKFIFSLYFTPAVFFVCVVIVVAQDSSIFPAGGIQGRGHRSLQRPSTALPWLFPPSVVSFFSSAPSHVSTPPPLLSFLHPSRRLCECFHLQPGGHLPGALQRHLQPAKIQGVADQVSRCQGHHRHLGGFLHPHAALPHLQHAQTLYPPRQQHGSHVSSGLAQ